MGKHPNEMDKLLREVYVPFVKSKHVKKIFSCIKSSLVQKRVEISLTMVGVYLRKTC